jgi:hypothetical protein
MSNFPHSREAASAGRVIDVQSNQRETPCIHAQLTGTSADSHCTAQRLTPFAQFTGPGFAESIAAMHVDCLAEFKNCD